MKRRGGTDKPNRQRKEAKNVMPAGVLREKEIKTSKLLRVNRFALKGMVKMVQQTKEKKSDALLHDGLSQFERQLIQECREDGMSDSEIQEWLREI